MPYISEIMIYMQADDIIRLINGQYVVIKQPGQIVQAFKARPPIDQSAEVAALTAQVAQLTADLATCIAGNPPPVLPTIANMTVTPNNLPVGGGSVVVNATVTGATSLALTLDGVAVPGPIVLPQTVVV